MIMYVFVHSRFIENPPIGSWETNLFFFRGGSVTIRQLCFTHLTWVFRLCEHYDFIDNPCGIPLDRAATYAQD
jgi:hypothetical protein